MSELKTVWVVESGDYDQRMVVCVAASRDAAVSHVKDVYGPPYVVQWSERETHSDGGLTLTGTFQAVPGKSTSHTAHFDISPELMVTQ